VLVLVFVSQPLLLLPSQSPKPALQVGEQAPATQLVLPFALVQALPQLAQLLVVLSCASQPSDTLLLQLPQPALQLIEQLPPLQEALPLLVEQTRPQPPQ
jgi:hypothetical protein